MIENILSNATSAAINVLWIIIGIYGLISISKIIIEQFKKK